MNLRRKLLAVALSTGLMGGITTMSAPTASAWAWDGYVHVAGNATCGSGPTSHPAVSVSMFGQISFADWLGNYGLDLYGVNKTWYGTATVRCSSPAGPYDYYRSVTVSRPWWGTQVNVSFNG